MGDEYPLLITVVYCWLGGPGEGVRGGTLTLIVPELGELNQSSVRGRLLLLVPPTLLYELLPPIPFVDIPKPLVVVIPELPVTTEILVSPLAVKDVELTFVNKF